MDQVQPLNNTERDEASKTDNDASLFSFQQVFVFGDKEFINYLHLHRNGFQEFTPQASRTVLRDMARYRFRSEGRFPLYPSKQDNRFFRSLPNGPQPEDTPHENPSKPRPIVRISATIMNTIAYIPRRLYCRLKYHSRNGCDGIKGAHSVVSPHFRQGTRASSAGVPEDERGSSGGSGTFVAASTSSAYSHHYAVSVTPPASDTRNTIPDPTANEIHRTLTRSARVFAANTTRDFRHRLANDFLVDTVHGLDEYIQMGEFASLEEILWERREERRRKEREQWRSDTGFWGGWAGERD